MDPTTLDRLSIVPAALFFILWAAGAVRMRMVRGRPDFTDDLLLRVFMFGWVGTVALFAAAIGAAIAARVLEPAVGPARTFFLSPYVGVLLAAGGVGLFVLKRRRQFLYGLIEATAALGAIATVSMSQQTMDTRLSAAVAAVYFLVRGLDNLTDSSRLRKLAGTWNLQKR